MPELPDEIEQQLASMSDADWDILTAKLRAPDRAEAFRDTASKWISGDRLDAVCSITNASLYVDAEGNIDAAKVEKQLRALFGDDIAPAGPQWQNHGQGTSVDTGQNGSIVHDNAYRDRGRAGSAEAGRRFGKPDHPTGNNAGAREAQRRFNTNTNGANN